MESNNRDQRRENEEVVMRENNAGASPAAKNYPSGYRFMPTDVELIREYLEKKIEKQPLPLEDIRDINLKKTNPMKLAEMYPKLGDNKWYFFTPRLRKYLKGERPDRGGDNGVWKATGTDREIHYQDKKIGLKKVLVYYQNQSGGRPIKTDWVMHEYRLPTDEKQKQKRKVSCDTIKLDDYVLCKIYKKACRPRTCTNSSSPNDDQADEEEDNSVNYINDEINNHVYDDYYQMPESMDMESWINELMLTNGELEQTSDTTIFDMEGPTPPTFHRIQQDFDRFYDQYKSKD